MIDVRNLSCRIGSRQIIQDISFSVRGQVLTALIGLNGSGKTTLMKLISGVLTPSKGEIHLNSTSLYTLSPQKIAKELAFVPQDFFCDFPFDVSEFVLMARSPWQQGLFFSAEDHQFTKDVLHRMNLRHLENRRLNTLSGGERQKVLIARALVQQSPVILFDEPTNHLDIKSRQEFFELLQSDLFAGKTVFSILHDIKDVQQHFDDVVAIRNGQLCFSGPVDQCLDRPRCEEVFEISCKRYFDSQN